MDLIFWTLATLKMKNILVVGQAKLPSSTMKSLNIAYKVRNCPSSKNYEYFPLGPFWRLNIKDDLTEKIAS